MLESLLIAIGGIVSMMITWVFIQFLWKKEFSDHLSDDDALAGRTKCSNCGCTTICYDKLKQYSPESK